MCHYFIRLSRMLRGPIWQSNILYMSLWSMSEPGHDYIRFFVCHHNKNRLVVDVLIELHSQLFKYTFHHTLFELPLGRNSEPTSTLPSAQCIIAMPVAGFDQPVIICHKSTVSKTALLSLLPFHLRTRRNSKHTHTIQHTANSWSICGFYHYCHLSVLFKCKKFIGMVILYCKKCDL